MFDCLKPFAAIYSELRAHQSQRAVKMTRASLYITVNTELRFGSLSVSAESTLYRAWCESRFARIAVNHSLRGDIVLRSSRTTNGHIHGFFFSFSHPRKINFTSHVALNKCIKCIFLNV